jgi:hypothetical protein
MYSLKVFILSTLCVIHNMKKIDMTNTCLTNTSVRQINYNACNEKLDKE